MFKCQGEAGGWWWVETASGFHFVDWMARTVLHAVVGLATGAEACTRGGVIREELGAI